MARKGPGFWTRDHTQKILEAYVRGEMTLAQADHALGGTGSGKFPPENVIEYYARSIRKRLNIPRPADVDTRSYKERERAPQSRVDMVMMASPSQAPVARDNVVTCRVSDRDMKVIDGLVAAVGTTRSEAAAWLISAGIEANKDRLEKLDTATQEIRRLREQMRTI